MGVLDELRDLQPTSTLGSVLEFFSGVPKPKRFSGRLGCSLGTKMKSGTKSTLYKNKQSFEDITVQTALIVCHFHHRYFETKPGCFSLLLES